MAIGSKAVQQTLARAHADLDADGLSLAIDAARASLPAAEVYDLFSPYLTVPAGAKKKGASKAKGARKGAKKAARKGGKKKGGRRR